MSEASRTVADMTGTDEIRQSAVALAALELVPGEPGDLTALLRKPHVRGLLFGDCRTDDISDRPLSELTTYLLEALDHGRVEHWTKIVERGVQSGRYRPLIAGSAEYPQRLAECADAPPVLFRSIGERRATVETSVLDRRALAIVGGRRTTGDVLEATRSVAAAVAAAGIHVVSGLAAGVDTAAHRGALDGGGLTTAVMGTGIDRIFPEENADLADMVADRGILLSQFAPPAPRTGTTFLRRNAVIAALAQTSLVMDARERSGSRHEMEQAQRYGRQILLWGPALTAEPWAAAMVRAGQAEFVESAEEVLSLLG